MVAVDGVDHCPDAGDELRDLAVGLRGGEFVPGVAEPQLGLTRPDHRRYRLGQPGDGRAEDPQETIRGVAAQVCVLIATQVARLSTSA